MSSNTHVYCSDILFSGKNLIEKGCIVIEGGTILFAGKRNELEPKYTDHIHELKGYTLMPGLIDAHIHYTGFRSGDYIKEGLLLPYATFVARAIEDLRRTINAGYTTVVDAGSTISLELKTAEQEGSIIAPRIVAAGHPISQTFGHGDLHFLHPSLVDPRTSTMRFPFQSLLCDGPHECRKAARYALRTGADFLKIFSTGGIASERDRPEYPQLTREEISAVVEEARRANRFVHSHAEGREGIINSLEAGITRIAHAIYIDQDGINLALENKAVIVPTLTIPDIIIKLGESAGLPEWAVEKTKEAYEAHISNIRKAYKQGVKLAAGTDFFINSKEYNLYGMNSLEILHLINEIGMTPEEALRAATLNGAYVAGLHGKIGLLKEGYTADIIAIKGNPFTDSNILLGEDNIHLVIKKGQIVKNKLITS